MRVPGTGQQPGDVTWNREAAASIRLLGHAPGGRPGRRRTGQRRRAGRERVAPPGLPGFSLSLTTGSLQILFLLRLSLLAKQLCGRPVRDEDGVPDDREGAYGNQIETY